MPAGDCRPGDDAAAAELDPDADPESIGRAILIRKLAAQDRTRHELATAMAAKNVPDEVAAGLLDRFEELGLVDDEAFAQRWVESRQARRHRSRLALRRELSGKGVDRETVDEVLSTVSVEDELDAARAYAEKVVGGLSGLESVSAPASSDRPARAPRLRLRRNQSGSERFGRGVEAAEPWACLTEPWPPPNLQTARYSRNACLI